MLTPIFSFSQTYSVENECDFILITKDTNLVKNIDRDHFIFYPCFDTKIGQATMYWFRIEDKGYIIEKIKISTL